MAYSCVWRKIGTCISYFLLGTACLFPQLSVAQDATDAALQIEDEFKQLLSIELVDWQQQAGLTKLKSRLDIKVPSGAKRLVKCSSALMIEPAKSVPLGNVQRKVSCEPMGWSLYVRASVDVKAKLPVANRVLKRGEQITMADIDWKLVKLGAADRDLVTDIEQIVGRQVVRKLRRYKPIKALQLSAPQWVNIGDRVIIEARSNGFYANMPGEALEGGGEGKAIRVKNLSSGKIISAYPIAKGRVATLF
ncbi:flagellar basal body P-ring formation protein FlgA [Shewanella sp. KX20019]|uniref:flagellar basal body P-ring formation chaperone FlgA n=1 Tax=Shewanella sp. KX20019 TaxID=2803864 RepID=UPI00192792A2|nr:flagellar basal body P-ring formation chaperone FlgA [Shewanella sp. KX20019]QQX80533.1 flagellar basal body P-ring formation protein FlgA [Shewanella sp. KX20019]